jgi:rubrerythrin
LSFQRGYTAAGPRPPFTLYKNDRRENMDMDKQMHNFEQVKDVLDYGRKLHVELREFYDSVSHGSEQARVKMLLDYLSRHERNREIVLERFETETRQGMLNLWLQYAPPSHVEERLRDCAIRPDMSVDDVLRIAMDFDNALIDLYDGAAKIVDDPHAKAVFANLVEMERQEKQRFIRDAEWMDDI